MFCFISEVW